MAKRSTQTTPSIGNRRTAIMDPDFHKGAIEDECRCAATNAPGLDEDGLPNDAVSIAADAIGARIDGTQG